VFEHLHPATSLRVFGGSPELGTRVLPVQKKLGAGDLRARGQTMIMPRSS